MRRLLILTATAIVAIGLALTTAGAASADPPAPPGTPTASPTTGVATVGPIFRGSLADGHECTASVVASPSRDLILTAAHCVVGDPAGWLFAPGYVNGRTPNGVWTITHAYFDPHWLHGQDTRYDYVLLQVATKRVHGHSVAVQDGVGGELLGLAPRPGSTVTDVAYNAGVQDEAISCTVPTYRTGGFPAFNCHGYVGGSSGSPWLSRLPFTHLNVVHGVIGGLHQGGCFEYTSYSSPFTPAVYQLLVQASRHQHPAIGPDPGSDGC